MFDNQKWNEFEAFSHTVKKGSRFEKGLLFFIDFWYNLDLVRKYNGKIKLNKWHL